MSDLEATLLAKGCKTLGLAVDADKLARLEQYLHLLQKWNAAFNLTAVREAESMRRLHVLDCLAVLPSLRAFAASRQGLRVFRVLDVGSGGGLPGIVLAIMEPGWEVHCVDAVAKKAAFLRQVSGELGLDNLYAAHARAQALTLPDGGFDLIISRAFASLPDFVGWTEHALASDGLWAAMKAQNPEAEIAALPPWAVVLKTEVLQVPGLEAMHRCLVWIERAPPMMQNGGGTSPQR